MTGDVLLNTKHHSEHLSQSSSNDASSSCTSSDSHWLMMLNLYLWKMTACSDTLSIQNIHQVKWVFRRWIKWFHMFCLLLIPKVPNFKIKFYLESIFKLVWHPFLTSLPNLAILFRIFSRTTNLRSMWRLLSTWFSSVVCCHDMWRSTAFYYITMCLIYLSVLHWSSRQFPIFCAETLTQLTLSSLSPTEALKCPFTAHSWRWRFI